jgi:hypothetical protein
MLFALRRNGAVRRLFATGVSANIKSPSQVSPTEVKRTDVRHWHRLSAWGI